MKFDWLENEYDEVEDPICDRNGPILTPEPLPESTPTEKPSTFGPGGMLENLRIRASLTPVCESPIEIDLGAALIQWSAGDFEIEPQRKIDRFRYDFAICKGGALLALVECDGAEFHSSEEAKENDVAKDKLAAEIGVRMFRCAGREIYRDPQSIASKIIGALR